jgi:hypothetical protein
MGDIADDHLDQILSGDRDEDDWGGYPGAYGRRRVATETRTTGAATPARMDAAEWHAGSAGPAACTGRG